ncbi:MAG: type II toxin-antitoxin system PemK/MazF family toxin, partial [Planctomycetes bacterium]|nr:type II toxin-antitoxin system PemK/MazF family toxin [Planctomycetota bacterium]
PLQHTFSFIPSEGGLKIPSVILCDQLRTKSKTRLIGPPWGTASSATMVNVEDILRNLLAL